MTRAQRRQLNTKHKVLTVSTRKKHVSAKRSAAYKLRKAELKAAVITY